MNRKLIMLSMLSLLSLSTFSCSVDELSTPLELSTGDELDDPVEPGGNG